MASQSELQTQLDFLTAELESYQIQLLSATTPEEIAELQNLINETSSQLIAVGEELSSLNEIVDGSDPYYDAILYDDDSVLIPEDIENVTFLPDDEPDVFILEEPPDTFEEDQEVDVFAPLEEPPNPDATEYDEFAGYDEAVAENEFGLQEPPQLSEEEAEAYLNNIEQPEFPSDEQNTLETAQGDSAALNVARAQKTAQDSQNAMAKGDWRVRLQLAPGANYLYKGSAPGILTPLIETSGVLFPYTPAISVSYAASYDGQELTHSNYKVFQYKSSAVDNINITCTFTAQDTFEANYLLAVIHFFKSVTKMFYGQDENPTNGTPPPLCYLTGMGAFQFDRHPLAVTSFTYNLPDDVDYIPAGSAASIAGVAQPTTVSAPVSRAGSAIAPGGMPAPTQFQKAPTLSSEVTYVPTKIQLTITAIPIISRNDISNNFSLKDYGTGQLLRGSINKGGTGIW